MDELEMARLREAAYRRCRQSGASREDADDCAQEALLVVLRGGQRTPASISTAWIRTVAHRRFVDLVRRRGRERHGTLPDPETDRTQQGPEDVVVGRLHARWLTSNLEALPLVTRQVCEDVGQGADVGTLANRYGLTRRSIESHLTRARRALRQLALKGLFPLVLLRTLRDSLSGSKTAGASTASSGATPAVLLAVTALSPLLLHSSTTSPGEPQEVIQQQSGGAGAAHGSGAAFVSSSTPGSRPGPKPGSEPAAKPSPDSSITNDAPTPPSKTPALTTQLPVKTPWHGLDKAAERVGKGASSTLPDHVTDPDRPQVPPPAHPLRKRQRAAPPAPAEPEPTTTPAPATSAPSATLSPGPDRTETDM